MINWLVNLPIGDEMAFDPIFTTNAVLVSITGSYPGHWVKAGYLKAAIIVDNVPFVLTSKLVRLGDNIILIGARNYQLFFEPVYYLSSQFNPIIKIAEQEIDMGVNFPSSRQTGDMITVSKIATAASQELLPENLDRAQGGTIYNKTNRVLYVRWGTTAATSSDILVPAGGNIDIPDEYTGAIQGISSNTGNGTIVIQTLSYV
jgi:hypothetical protein